MSSGMHFDGAVEELINFGLEPGCPYPSSFSPVRLTSSTRPISPRLPPAACPAVITVHDRRSTSFRITHRMPSAAISRQLCPDR